jgi:two-component system cell cycle sensor histidine kinase/response regulator CckA
MSPPRDQDLPQFHVRDQSIEDFAVAMLDPAGIVISWNIGAEHLSGYKAEEIIGRSVAIIYLPENITLGKLAIELKESAENGRISRVTWFKRKDNHHFLAECLTFALEDPSGNLVGFCRVIRDITSQRLEQESLRSAMDHSVDAIFTINEGGIIQSCGGAATKIFGFDAKDLIGRPVTMLMPEPWHSEHYKYILNYTRTGVAKVMGHVREVIGLRRDGTHVPLELVVTEFQLNSDRFFTGILRDITERKRMEELLRQSQKMEAIGRLAGGIAHDFNNLLTVILGFAEVVLTSLDDADPNRRLVAEVVNAGDRAAALTNQLVAFSRKQVLVSTMLNLNDIIENCVILLRRVIGENIHIITEFDNLLYWIKADRSQIEQVIMNLVVNSRDAMPQGGTLTISTRNTNVDEERQSMIPGCKSGNYVAMRFSDTGCGMTPEVQAHAFEPFFTTKETGKGTGLGLATVYGIVKQSEGHIEVFSVVGVGTTFNVLLPAATEQFGVSQALEEDTAARGHETILLVEDEEGVRQLTGHILQMLGYRVLQASDGQSALDLESTIDESIQLLVTDIVMPEISGRRLADLMLIRHPDLKVLFISAYTDDLLGQPDSLKDMHPLLQKPFSFANLAKTVRDVLDSPASAKRPQ